MTHIRLLTTLREHEGPVWSLAWSPSGLLASCGSDCRVALWKCDDLGNCTLITKSPASAFLRSIRDITWSSDARSLAAASFDSSTTVLELTGGPNPLLDPAVCLEGHDAEVKSVAFSSSGGLLATCSRDRSIWLWEVGLDFEYECIAVLNGHGGDVKKVAWHPSMEMLVSCSFDESIRIWVEDEDDWFCSETLMAHSGSVWDVSFNDKGSALASVGADACLVIWKREQPPGNVIGASPRFVVDGRIDDIADEPIYAVDWYRGKQLLALACGDDSIRIATMAGRVEVSPSNVAVASDPGPSNNNQSQASDGAASSVPVSSRLRETWEITHVQTRAHHGDVNRVAWKPGESILASCGDDGEIKIWQLEEAD